MSCLNSVDELESVVQGNVVRLRAKFYDSVGTAVDPETVTIHYKASSISGSTINSESYPSGDVVRESTGSFYYDLLVDEVGRWDWRWTATGAVAAAQGEFSVEKANLEV